MEIIVKAFDDGRDAYTKLDEVRVSCNTLIANCKVADAALKKMIDRIKPPVVAPAAREVPAAQCTPTVPEVCISDDDEPAAKKSRSEAAPSHA